MSIDNESLRRMLNSAASAMKGESGLLSDIDSRFGDGDHGVTIEKIANVIERETTVWRDGDGMSARRFLENLGEAIMAVGGGSAGPLYGTMIGGLAGPLADETDEAKISPALLKAMLGASLDAMREITKARVGDKTMMDALIPAVEAAQNAPLDVAEILFAACRAAEEGAAETEKFVSKFGRARSYKEQTIGTRDAGAVSTSLFFKGLAAVYKE